jgi:hypothetical protein
MMRGVSHGPILAVEGPSDADAYARAVQGPRFVAACGKRMVIDALRLLGDAPGVAGLIDSDYDRLISSFPDGSVCLFMTDTVDMDSWLFFNRGFWRLCDLLIPLRRTANRAELEEVRRLVILGAMQAGTLRLLNDRDQIGINFSTVPWRSFFSTDSGLLVSDRIFAYFSSTHLRHSPRTWAAIRSDYDTLLQTFRSPLRSAELLCNGHDLIRFFSFVALERRWLAGKQADVDYLEQIQRRATTAEDVASTRLVRSLERWVQLQLGAQSS